MDLLVDWYHDQVSLHRLEIELQLEIKARLYCFVYEQNSIHMNFEFFFLTAE